MKIKVIVFIAILFLASRAPAQTESAPAANNPALKEKALKANQQRQLQKGKSAESQNANQSVTSIPVTGGFQLNEDDQYQGRRQEFLSQMTVHEIPSDFPKYNKSYGVEKYNGLVETYYSAHKGILIESVRTKLESQGK